MMLLHTKEGLLPNVASNKPTLGKYFSFIIRATREFGFEKSLHPFFASKAKLNTSRSLNPMPPLLFGASNLSQLIHGIRPWFDLCPHQNRLMRS
jgi:hypothetical protein